MLLEPLARAAVPLQHADRLFPLRVRPQHVREEVVVAVPAPLVVEWNDEEVPALQGLERDPATSRSVTARLGVSCGGSSRPPRHAPTG